MEAWQDAVRECEAVRLRAPGVGRREADGARVAVPAGTRGAVVVCDPGSPWIGVAVPGEAGPASLHVWVHRDDLMPVGPHGRDAVARLRRSA